MLYIENACPEINKKCLHPCYGAKCKQFNQGECIPCLHPECVKKNEKLTLGTHSNEDCMICYTETLGQSPTVQLNCNHFFHFNCLNTVLTNKWNGARIQFGYLDCPACAQQITKCSNHELDKIVRDDKCMQEEVYQKAEQMGVREELDKDPRLQDPTDIYYQNFREFAYNKLAFYQCFDCKQPYFGGMRDCEQEAR